MGNLPREIQAEKENVVTVLDHLENVASRKQRSIVELSAMAAFLHNTKLEEETK